MADWTDEEITVLRQKWTEGLTATQISKELKNTHSRCAVIGKAQRLGLAKRLSGFQPAVKEIKMQQPRHDAIYKTTHTKPLPVSPPPPPVEVKPVVEAKPVEPKPPRFRVKLPKEFNNEQFFQNWIANLRPRLPEIFRIPKTGYCKYIFGEVSDKANAHWCGKKTGNIESSWCPYHKGLVYQKPGTYRLTGRRRRKT